MNFREIIKNILFTKLDINAYKKNNPDLGENYTLHYEKYGFDEGRRAYFNINEKRQSQLLAPLEIQHLRSKALPNISIVPEMFNGTPSPCSYIRHIFPLQYLEFLNELNIDDEAVYGKIWALNRKPNFEAGLAKWIDSIGPEDLILYDLDDDLISHYGEYSEDSKLIILFLLLADKVTVSTYSLNRVISKLNIKSEIRKNFNLSNPTVQQSDFDNDYSILYMGTPTHHEDFKLIQDALEIISLMYPKIKIDTVGMNEITKNKEFNNINILNSYYPGFMENYENIKTYKIGIIPLLNNKLNKSKSNIKYYDYLNKCQYVLSSDVGEYKNTDLCRLSVVKGGSKEDWIKEIVRLINLPKIRNSKINKSLSSAREVKFTELEKLSNIINSLNLLSNYKIIKYKDIEKYFKEDEIYNIFLKRYSIKDEVSISNLKEGDGDMTLNNIINNQKSLLIEDLQYLQIPIKELISKIKKNNKDFSLAINVKKNKNENKYYDINKDKINNKKIIEDKNGGMDIAKELEINNFKDKKTKIYIENLQYIYSLSILNSFKSITQICYQNYDVFIIFNKKGF